MTCAYTNIITAPFDGLHVSRTRSLYQYDYGQLLQITGVELPFAYEVHFATSDTGGDSITQIGNEDGVIIPDELLTLGVPLYAFIYLHTDEEDGETVYQIIIPVKPRPAITNQEPTPVQQDAITQAIAALDAAVEQTGEDVQTTAENVQRAQEARSGAELAQTLAEAAQAASEAAQTASEAAQAGAEDAQRGAELAQSIAEVAAQNARLSEDHAEDAADRAEQSAAVAGYMFFHIDNRGHLIYEHTTNVDVEFYLYNGHLYVGVDE